MNSLILAALLTLQPGYNNPGVAGEVVAIEAATTNATATIAIKSVQSITAYTNATAQVVNFETAYALTYTNYDGSAAISTNVIGYVDYDYFKTNGVSKIISGPTRFDMPITNTVITATLPAATYAKTNDVASVTTSAHFGSVTTNAFLFGDALLVTGAAEGDSIKVLLK
ncbi:MAG: hypothetical protein IIZ06_00020 [Kiritimatiellae bacterium]|nr:hypothetical protein [Kiritimatiellia bacterium]